MAALTVTRLNIYPVKSCGGVGLSSIALTDWGPEGDRRFMLVDRNNVFVTARKYPRLLQVKVALMQQGLLLTANKATPLRISVAGLESVAQDSLTTTVWGDQVQAHEVSEDSSQWFSELLGLPVRLVYMPSSGYRQVDRNYFAQDQRVSFADGFPLLLTHQSSLDELNQRLAEPVSMQRFRPNIVVAGGEPWAEDQWHEIQIGDIRFAAVKPCSRCIMTTIDPKTLKKGREPLTTLSGYRRTDFGVIFGQNMVNLDQGIISVGDKVKLIH